MATTKNVTSYTDTSRGPVSLNAWAAGATHDINNSLNAIINYARILCDECEPGGQTYDIANLILAESRRLADIASDFFLCAQGEHHNGKHSHR